MLHGFSLILGDVEITIVRCLKHRHYTVKAPSKDWGIWKLQADTIHGQGKFGIHFGNSRLLSTATAIEQLTWIHRSWHELQVYVATAPHLGHIRRR